MANIYDDLDLQDEDFLVEETELLDDEPLDDDYIISDKSYLGGYSVANKGGRHIGNYRELSEVAAAIDKHSRSEGFYPNSWYINDHGNIEPFDPYDEPFFNY